MLKLKTNVNLPRLLCIVVSAAQIHHRSTIGNHVKDEHGKDPETIGSNFQILKKCQ